MKCNNIVLLSAASLLFSSATIAVADEGDVSSCSSCKSCSNHFRQDDPVDSQGSVPSDDPSDDLGSVPSDDLVFAEV